MTAPLLELAADHPSPSNDPGLDGGLRHFRVRRGGTFRGQQFVAGDVLVVGGPSRGEWPVVLVARGLGRPRLGTQRGLTLLGEVGEPCSAMRWEAAGRVIGVIRSANATGVQGLVQAFDGQDWTGPQLHEGPVRSVRSGPRQLSLFAA